MSDIIRFPQLGRTSKFDTSALTAAEEEAADLKMSDLYEAQTRSPSVDRKNFEVSSDSIADFPQNPSSLSAPITGWSNQELADLYRTQRILTLAGIHTKVDHGITDEGDPWFVFMDAQNEVFVHFSRFDGFYLATSQMHEAAIKGTSLQDLVSEFSKRVSPATGDGPSGKNVVSIAGRSRNAVLIHPAAALAALVWSIYLMSDDLVAAAPMTHSGELENPEKPDFTNWPTDAHEISNDLDVLPKVAQKALQVLSDPVLAKHFTDPLANRDAVGMTVTSGTSVKALGVGLSLVAFSIGLPILDSVILTPNSDTKSSQASIQDFYALLTDAREEDFSLEIFDGRAFHSQSDLVFQVEDGVFAEVSDKIDRSIPELDSRDEIDILLDSLSATYQKNPQGFSGLEEELTPRFVSTEDTGIHEGDSNAATEEMPTLQELGDEPFTASASKNDLLQRFDTEFESYKLTELASISLKQLGDLLSFLPQDELDSLLSSITHDNLDGQLASLSQDEVGDLLSALDETEATNPAISSETVSMLETPLPAVETVQYDAFDEEARIFLDFLLSTYIDIRIINLPTDIIFIHMDALESDSNHGQIYSKSWSFDESGTITTIGLKSDMIQFDLVA